METESSDPVALGMPSATMMAPALRVLLVNMPWSSTTSPSIQCGLLQALTRRAGHECEVAYLNLEFAARLGGDVYSEIADMSGERLHMLGEWLFSFAAFGETTPDTDYLHEFPEVASCLLDRGWDGDALAKLRRVDAPAWIEDVASRSSWETYDVVGFTSTFLQADPVWLRTIRIEGP